MLTPTILPNDMCPSEFMHNTEAKDSQKMGAFAEAGRMRTCGPF